MPPKWAPLKIHPRLEEDSGEYFRDINAANYPMHSLEPAVTAVLAQSGDIAGQADIFACGSTLENLVQFVTNADKTFRFLVEVVGETVFLVRRENSPLEKIPDIRGYGHTFPDAYTSLEDSVKGSVTHQRLISYDFAGLELIVRSEVDGYLSDLADDAVESSVTSKSVEGLSIVAGGRAIPQEALFDPKTRNAWDFKTRRARKRSDEIFEQEVPKLWIKQIPNMIVAYNQRGVFDDIDVMQVQARVDKWEKEHAVNLENLAAVLKQIVTHARHQAGDAFEVCCQTPGKLEFRTVGGQWSSALSDELKAKWTDTVADEMSDSSGVYVSDADDGIGDDDDDDAGSTASDESVRDYTACDASSCGYCGRCRY